jgi:hypothetical protein
MTAFRLLVCGGPNGGSAIIACRLLITGVTIRQTSRIYMLVLFS